MKYLIFAASLAIGALVSVGPAYNAGFSPDSLSKWLMNGLFVAAIVGWIGIKFFYNKK